MTTTAKATLIASLVKAQSQMTGASKDATNPHFKAGYATLASVWDTIRKPLTDNGLAVTQHTEWRDEAGVMILTTILRHVSGETIQCEYPVLADYANPQRIGSALTYARRYSLMSLVGVAPDDDDGNEASVPQNGQKRQANGNGTPAMIGDGQKKYMHKLGTQLYGENWDDERHRLVKHITAGRTESSDDLTGAQADKLIVGMSQKLAEVANTAAPEQDKFDELAYGPSNYEEEEA